MSSLKEWAEANKYLYKLMAGSDDLLVDYVDFITSREDEIFLGLCSIMIATNRYQLDVDYILDKFKKYIVLKEQRNHIGKIIQQVTADRYTRLLAELGIYYLNTNRYESGLKFILESLENSIKINSDKGMLRCMGVFEQFRHYSSNELQQKYKYLVKDVQSLNNKNRNIYCLLMILYRYDTLFMESFLLVMSSRLDLWYCKGNMGDFTMFYQNEEQQLEKYW